MGNTVSQVYVHFTFKGRVTDEMAPATLSCGVHFQHQGSLTLCSGHLNLSYHLSFSHTQSQLQLKSRAPSTAVRSTVTPSVPSGLYLTSNCVREALAASAGASAFAPSGRDCCLSD